MMTTADADTPAAAPPARTSPSAATGAPVKNVRLESLAPKFVEAQHGTYLRRLNEAVKDTDNLNIAVTGRYGAGKSSVLDQFARTHGEEVLRLAISTLAPGEDGESTTNRIQKEIVKQLLYGASKKVGRFSRFNKIASLAWPTALWQSALVVVPLGLMAYVFGLLPDLDWPPIDVGWGWRLLVWVGAAAVLTGLGAVIRMLTYDRVNVSDVSAGGAALTLTAAPKTFFDKYIDEIVHYFTQESKDFVIFEDLDRFEDPNIFEALRELNVLLNNTPERQRKPNGTVGQKQPLRFIYAVRDSVFSKIDAASAMTNEDEAKSGDPAALAAAESTPGAAPVVAPAFDEAAAETRRANRTKFFDVVIPMVPFISHRNARDLLASLLEDRGITGIDARLVNTVARHCTDMRLMRNMCNEYLIFAERLLEPLAPAKVAPGLDATHLFALVVYKNFHLEDFENITRRDSDLDRLYDFAQRLVRKNIADLNQRRRDLETEEQRVRTRDQDAERMGRVLDHYADMRRQMNNPWGWNVPRFAVGSKLFSPKDLSTYTFWSAVAQAQSLTIAVAISETSTQHRDVYAVDADWLATFVPESLQAHRWTEFDEATAARPVAEIEDNVSLLRCATFEDLVKAQSFKVELTGDEAARLNPVPEPGQAQTFAELVEATLKSRLAAELVRRGYIDRNFSLYAAQFYGNFSGVDVATFMVQHVQPNVMSIDYDLSRPRVGDQEGAVANLINEAEDAGEELLETAAAWNIDIVNHLLRTDEDSASTVASQLILSWPSKDANDFLSRYFTSENAERTKLAELLAACGWRHVYTYVVSDDGVPSTARTRLLNAALAGFDPNATYDLDDGVLDHIAANYGAMDILSGDQPLTHAAEVRGYDADDPSKRPLERVVALLHRAAITFAELEPLRPDILERVVAESSYRLTADNLRTALDLPWDASIAMEAVRADENVYEYCRTSLSAYLSAVDGDERTDHAVDTPGTLVAVLLDLVGDIGDEETADFADGKVADLLAHTAPGAQLNCLPDAPASTWTPLAAANLFRPSLANIEAYRATHGGVVDEQLGALLAKAGTVQVDEEADTLDADGNALNRQGTAIAILNASTLSPETRTVLASSFDAQTPLPVDGISPESSNLFALLLGLGLVDDDEITFAHVRVGGWAALGPALNATKHLHVVLSPGLLTGFVADALTASSTSDDVGNAIIDSVEEYVPEDDWNALRAVADYAHAHQRALTPQTVARVARVGDDEGELNVPLVLDLLAGTSPTVDAATIVETFLHLGDPYDLISTTGKKFERPNDDVHEKLLRILDSEGLVTRGWPRRGKRVSVTVS